MQQQTKLIDYLQEKYETPMKKKKVGSVFYLKSPTENR